VTPAPALPRLLEPGETVTLQVTFDPSDPGEALTSIRIVSNDYGQPIVVVPVQGTGLGPILELAPAAVDFGEQLVGTTSLMTITLANVSPANVPLVLDLQLADSGGRAFAIASVPASPLAPEATTS